MTSEPLMLGPDEGEIVVASVTLRIKPDENPEFCHGWTSEYNAVQFRPTSKWGSPSNVFVRARWADMKAPRDAQKIGRLFTETVEITGRLVVGVKRADGTRGGALLDWDVLPAKTAPAPVPPPQAPRGHHRGKPAQTARPDPAKAARMAEEFFRYRQKEAEKKAADEACKAAWRAACPPPENLHDLRRAALESCRPATGQSTQDMLWQVFGVRDWCLPPLALAWQEVAKAMLLVWSDAGIEGTTRPGSHEAHLVQHYLKYGEKKALAALGFPLDGRLWSADADAHGGLCGFSD